MKYTIIIVGSLMLLGLINIAWAQKRSPKKFPSHEDKATPSAKKGGTAEQAKQNEQIVRFYTRAIRRKGKDVSRAYERRAMLYCGMKQYDNAIADYTILIRIGKKPANYYYHRAKVRAEAGDLPGAIHDIDSAIALSKAPLTYYLARAEFRSLDNDYEGALADCQAAIDIQPSDGGSYWTRGNIYLRQGKTAKACEDFYRADEFGYQDAAKMLGLYCSTWDHSYTVTPVPHQKIQIDGSPGDWSGIPVFMRGGVHAKGHHDSSDYDIDRIFLARDSQYLCVLLQFSRPLTLLPSHSPEGQHLATLWFDTDNNRATGGEEPVYQLAGFEQRVQISIRPHNDSLHTGLILSRYDAQKQLQSNPFSQQILPAPLIRHQGAYIELMLPLDQLHLSSVPGQPFRVIFTEYKQHTRSPFPSYFYGQVE